MRARKPIGMARACVALAILILAPARSEAGAVYSVTDLGPYANPTGDLPFSAEQAPVRIDQAGNVTSDRLGFNTLGPAPLAAIQAPYAAGHSGLYPAIGGSHYQVGYVSSTDPASSWQALVWNGTTGQALGPAPPTRLGDPAHFGWFSIATGVNDLGHAVGSGGTGVQDRSAPMAWGLTSDGSDPFAGVRGQLGPYSDALGINDKDQIVGTFHSYTDPHAFLFANGTLIDLNGAIPATSGLTLASATGINDAGRIVAIGTDASGQARAFLLTPDPAPVPEPATLAVFGLACVAFGLGRWRGNRP